MGGLLSLPWHTIALAPALLLVVGTFAAWVIVRAGTPPLRQSLTCRQAYARSRTAADSAIADAIFTGNARTPGHLTCAEERRMLERTGGRHQPRLPNTPARQQSSRGTVPAGPSEPGEATPGDCLTEAPARVAITGELRREVHLGPPGYGETPARDEGDTIVVLVPRVAVPVCVDTSRGGGKSVRWEVDRFQLVGIPHTTLDHVGRRVTAYGGH